MPRPTHMDRTVVVANLRSRALHDRADWVLRTLPASIDVAKNASLFRTLGIDVADCHPGKPEARPAAG